VRCCRANCRCAQDELHGPYHYRFYRDGGRLRKRYIKPADVAEVRKQCDARRKVGRELVASWQAWQELVARVKEAERK